MTCKPIDYCEVVMEGGITNGMTYPSAVLALAKRCRFKNIGGTSAGAITAAAHRFDEMIEDGKAVGGHCR